MITDPADLQARMLAAAPDIELSFRKMFGGIMGYAAEVPFASLSDVGLALKFFGAEHSRALALPGAKALQYEPGAPVSKSYVVLPAEVVEDANLLHEWIVTSANNLQGKSK
ncbi:MAG: TfoX/Sxy family protein [Sphingomonadaceae bacterium]|nr:TfoX/Sxy family protein [Sphingomonadaceae bacterium]